MSRWLARRSSAMRGRHHEIVEPDGKATHADPGRVPYRVGDGTGRAGDADLAHALDAERVDMGIMLLDRHRLERWHIGVHGDVILREIGIQRPAGPPVDDGMLMERE